MSILSLYYDKKIDANCALAVGDEQSLFEENLQRILIERIKYQQNKDKPGIHIKSSMRFFDIKIRTFEVEGREPVSKLPELLVLPHL
ncbi:hypothetical protein [Legionella fallonii]|uniref:Uncharacterized protein n=1 Tax=Legionella fallonii LLAP-10 TaxID=1212491 RepID=A0A098G3U8_9GAMM|nr:hypothetical protein [Legionella fallonii]CEG57152.1 protein of unknown function [Legionella fallonii LLAP-10]